MVRRGHFEGLLGIFLMGCALFMAVGCAGVRSGAPEEEQGHTEATGQDQGRSPEATTSEEARCEGTRFIFMIGRARYTTNDLPGCPDKGGPLSGTGKGDLLAGKKGEDEVRALGGSDELHGGDGSDVIYGGPGGDFLSGGRDNDVLYGGDGADYMVSGDTGEDVLHGGDGDDYVDGRDEGVKDTQRDELYCGAGTDKYIVGRLDYVASSCEVAHSTPPGTPRRVRVD